MSEQKQWEIEEERLKHEYVSGPRLPYLCARCGQQIGWRSPTEVAMQWSHVCEAARPEPGELEVE